MLLAMKPVSSETSKSRMMVNFDDRGSLRDSWPIAFSGDPRGPRVACETGCPKYPASSERDSLSECLQNLTATARENIQRWSGVAHTQAVCGFRYLASELISFFIEASRSVDVGDGEPSRGASHGSSVQFILRSFNDSFRYGAHYKCSV
jgi:hypothetical protein